jgi:hypothetical protein
MGYLKNNFLPLLLSGKDKDTYPRNYEQTSESGKESFT